MITNSQARTSVDEIADGIYRISTPVTAIPGGFTFNQHLIIDDEPLIFHTGPRKMFPLVREAIEAVMPIERLRWISFSHVEADECGGLNELLAVAPRAEPVTGTIGTMVSVNDLADRSGRALERLAATKPRTLACMHGPDWRGDGVALLRALAELLAR